MDLSRLFGGCYLRRRVLVTGHTGFKGSWLVLWLRAMGAQVAGLALDPDTDPAHWRLLDLSDVSDARIDLRDADAVHREVCRIRPQIVFHLAAQALVRRSYREPAATFASNVTGLVNLLEAVRACGEVEALVNATTDKVYAEAAKPDGYAEIDPLGGHDPYSTSKACAELVTECYRRSFYSGVGLGPRTATARAGNVIGGGDWAEDRLLPDVVRAATTGRPLRLRHPDAVRPWQHVLEPLSGYLRLGQALLAGDDVEGAWNFGPGAQDALPVRILVERVRESWPQFEVEPDRGPHPHEAARLTLDCRKSAAELDWQPTWDADTAIRRTLEWFRAQHQHGQLRSADDLLAYVASARMHRQSWSDPA